MRSNALWSTYRAALPFPKGHMPGDITRLAVLAKRLDGSPISPLQRRSCSVMIGRVETLEVSLGLSVCHRVRSRRLDLNEQKIYAEQHGQASLPALHYPIDSDRVLVEPRATR